MPTESIYPRTDQELLEAWESRALAVLMELGVNLEASQVEAYLRAGAMPLWSVPPQFVGIVEAAGRTESICRLFQAPQGSLRIEFLERRQYLPRVPSAIP